jgi:hypothetical protein
MEIHHYAYARKKIEKHHDAPCTIVRFGAVKAYHDRHRNSE